MRKISSHLRHGYTLLVDGNDGEEQFVMTYSFGQNLRVNVTIVHVGVDFSMHVPITCESMPNESFPAFVAKQLTLWVIGGIPPTRSEYLEQCKRIETIVEGLSE